MIGRDGWEAADPGEGMVAHIIERLTVHHTGVELGDNRLAPSRLRAHQQFHQNDRGWPDLAYHFAIDRGGNIYEGRSLDFRGDTATSYDTTGHLLIVLEGNFDVEELPEPQLGSLTDLLAWSSIHYAVGTNTIRSHRDYAEGETSCPGAKVYALLASGELVEAVNASLLEGAIELSYLQGADALDLVAAIEAG